MGFCISPDEHITSNHSRAKPLSYPLACCCAISAPILPTTARGAKSLTSWYRLCIRQSFRQLPPQPSRRGKSPIARFGGENGLGAQGKTHGQCHTHHTIFHRVILSEIRSGRFSALSVTRRRAVGRHHASGKTNNVVAIGCGRIQVGITMVALAGPQPQG